MKIAEAWRIPRLGKTSKRWPSKLRVHEKRKKARAERRRAKRNPECAPAYSLFRRWW